MKDKLLFFVCSVFFFLNTQFNFFHLAEKDIFQDSDREISETLITGKLLNSEVAIFEDGGFPGVFVIKNSEYKSYNRSGYARESHEKYLHDEQVEKHAYLPYKTQIGGQGILYSFFQKTFSLPHSVNYQIFRSFNSLILSICLAGFVMRIRKKFGFRVAVISAFLILVNYWIFLFGKSIWWCSWVYFLPLVFSLRFFEGKKHPNFRKYILYMSLLFFIKFWFTGFEFITTFLICSAIPYIYYHLENSRDFYLKFIGRHFVITIVPLLLMLVFLLFQFNILTGSFSAGAEHLQDAFLRRTSDGYHYPDSMQTMNSLKKLHIDIIVRYLGNSFISRHLFNFPVPFLVIFLMGLFSGIYLFFKKIERKLVFITLFSLAAPLSWLVLFKQHAHIHTHIDFIVWYLPTLLFVIILISLTIDNLLSNILTLNRTN